MDSLRRFITQNKLDVENGMILFDAAVIYYEEPLSFTIGSQIQIITLPKQMALYVYEFLKVAYKRTEMYNTPNFDFFCSASGTLKISEREGLTNRLLLSILPL